jgi:hypothetical protein
MAGLSEDLIVALCPKPCKGPIHYEPEAAHAGRQRKGVWGPSAAFGATLVRSATIPRRASVTSW